MESAHSPQATRILDCAQELISAGGYNGFSYADISARVGITKASIHHHFPTKADLVRSLVERYRTAASEGLAGLDAHVADPAARLKAYGGWWSKCIVDGSMPICVCALLSSEAPVLPEEVAAEVRMHFATLVQWLESVLAAGRSAKTFALRDSPAAEAEALMASVHGAMLTARLFADPRRFDVVMKAALKQLSPAS